MMIRKKITVLIALTLLGTSLCAKEANSDFREMQEFFKELGYKEAKSKYYNIGYEQAYRDMMEVFKLYKLKMKAQQAGKYLSRKAKVTYEVYKKQNPVTGSYSMHIVAPAIEEELTPETLAMLPDWGEYIKLVPNKALLRAANEKKFNNQQDQFSNNFQGMTNLNSASNSFNLPQVGEYNENVTSIEAKPKPFKASKSKEIKDLLEGMNIKYSENPTYYHVFFENKTQEKAFCIRYTGGDERCEKIN